MRRHLPNTLHHTDCTRRATAGKRNRYVRAAHIIYGTAAGNIIPATTVAPKYGNGSPVPVSGINFSYRIDHKKITDAAAIRLNSSKNSVKLRHYHVEYHRIRFIIRPLAPLSTATRRGNIIKFSRNSSCFSKIHQCNMIFVFLQSRHYGQCRYLIRIYITVFSEQERRLTSPALSFFIFDM